jgi:hypothetical protein
MLSHRRRSSARRTAIPSGPDTALSHSPLDAVARVTTHHDIPVIMANDIPTVLDVLLVVAPGGIVPGDDFGFSAALAHLQAAGVPATLAGSLAIQVQAFCRDRGIWSMADGRRCLLLPGFR